MSWEREKGEKGVTITLLWDDWRFSRIGRREGRWKEEGDRKETEGEGMRRNGKVAGIDTREET